MLQFIQGQGAIGIQPLARDRRARRLGRRLAWVAKIEFKLGRHDRGQAKRLVAIHDVGQGVARIAGEGQSVFGAHPEHHQRRGAACPVHQNDGAACVIADAVGIAGFKHQLVVFNILAPDIHAEDRKRHPKPAIHDLFGFFDRQAFAAHRAVQIADAGKDGLDLRALLKPVPDVVRSHSGVPFLATPSRVSGDCRIPAFERRLSPRVYPTRCQRKQISEVRGIIPEPF